MFRELNRKFGQTIILVTHNPSWPVSRTESLRCATAESFTTAIRCQPMKRFLLWSFERGSRPYDVICVVILAFIFLTPTSVFNDRPDYMRIDRNDPVRRTHDDTGNVVYNVQIDTPAFTPASAAEKAAIDRLRAAVHDKFEISRALPVYDSTGVVIAYAIWIDTGVQPF